MTRWAQLKQKLAFGFVWSLDFEVNELNGCRSNYELKEGERERVRERERESKN